jgi:DNA-binding MarR family transcriptional regulator
MKINDLAASMRELYQRTVLPVCKEYDLTYMEFSVLLFLANNPEYDTAAEIVSRRQLTKSHVSISVQSLRERGYLSCSRGEGDRRAVHLRLLPAADAAVREGQAAQEAFAAALLRGFTDAERAQLQLYFGRIEENIAACGAGKEPEIHG